MDNIAFESLWQNSQASLTLALKQSAYATVAEVDGQIIGYQISTGSGYSAHLARLAVLPRLQRKAIGYQLVRDLLEYFANREIYRITVNTQDNNPRLAHPVSKTGVLADRRPLSGDGLPITGQSFKCCVNCGRRFGRNLHNQKHTRGVVWCC